MLAVMAMSACQAGVDSACGDYVDRVAAQAAQCDGFVFDDDTKSAFVELCKAAAAAPGAGDYAGGLGACGDAIEKADCGPVGDACTIVGTLPEGAPCGIDAQCASGDCDRTAGMRAPNSDISCGTCSTYLPVGAACGTSKGSCDPRVSRCSLSAKCEAYGAVGDACEGVSCAPSLLCDPATNTCQEFPTEGEPCTIGCHQPFICESGTCHARSKEGEPCPTLSECELDLVCNAMHVCAQPKRVGEGETCGLVDGGQVVCEDGLGCDQSSMKCVKANGPAGRPCTPGQFDCGELLACVDGTCQVPDYALCGK